MSGAGFERGNIDAPPFPRNAAKIPNGCHREQHTRSPCISRVQTRVIRQNNPEECRCPRQGARLECQKGPRVGFVPTANHICCYHAAIYRPHGFCRSGSGEGSARVRPGFVGRDSARCPTAVLRLTAALPPFFFLPQHLVSHPSSLQKATTTRLVRSETINRHYLFPSLPQPFNRTSRWVAVT